MRVALDTNVLAYAEGVGDDARCRAARTVVAKLPATEVVLPVQALGELHRVLVRKAGRSGDAARAAILGWSDAFDVADSTWDAMRGAIDLAGNHQMPIWDALILSVAADQKCRMLLSEDFQHEFVWRGVTVVDPFRNPRHTLLAAALQ